MIPGRPPPPHKRVGVFNDDLNEEPRPREDSRLNALDASLVAHLVTRCRSHPQLPRLLPEPPSKVPAYIQSACLTAELRFQLDCIDWFSASRETWYFETNVILAGTKSKHSFMRLPLRFCPCENGVGTNSDA